jgi:intein/homing endonuclease
MNVREAAHITSRELGKEKGYCFEKLKRRNSCLTTIAPTGCQIKDNIIRTIEGDKSIKQILEDNNIDYFNIERKGQKQWFNIKSIILPTIAGEGASNRIYYNGLSKVKKITFEDGKNYEFTENHPLLVNRNNQQVWVQVKDLVEGDDVVQF